MTCGTGPTPDTWLRLLAQVPLLHQPGDAWLYGTSSDLQGILVARASGRALPDFLAERIFAPLGMADTGFAASTRQGHRLTSTTAHLVPATTTSATTATAMTLATTTILLTQVAMDSPTPTPIMRSFWECAAAGRP